jgi:hypothetical protein
MPRLYMTTDEFLASPPGIALAAQINQLPSGSLDTLLFRASARCDAYTHKRLALPGSTTISQPVSPGSTTLSIASTLQFDNLAESAVQIGTGGTQEIIALVPGGVTPTWPLSPYPGTLTLAAPCVYAHSIGEPVVGLWQEISEAGSSSSSEPFTEAITQEAQLAQAHAPALARSSTFTSLIFLKSYPIQSVLKVEHSYPYSPAVFNSLTVSSMGIEPTAGFLRLLVGSVVIPQGFIRVTYVGGYASLPEEIKTAVSYYVADELQPFWNPAGVSSSTMGKRSLSFQSDYWKTRAEDILETYRRRV